MYDNREEKALQGLNYWIINYAKISQPIMCIVIGTITFSAFNTLPV